MMDVNVDLLKWFLNFSIKKLLIVVLKMKISIKNQQKNYTNELLANLIKRKLHSIFIDNAWGADLAGIQLISKFNKGFRFLLCVVDIYSKYASFIPIK